MLFLYNLVVLLASQLLKLTALFSPKMRLFVDGRKSVFQTLAAKIQASDKTIWFHAASLGEYEQGLPVIEAVKQQFPSHKIIVTFFSPSGFEVRKNNAIADVTLYLPLDSISNAKQFIKLAHPEMVFFIKYEYWPNYLNELKKQNIKTYLISGVLRENQAFFKWYGAFYRNALKAFDFFFVQNETSVELLKSLQFRNVRLTGDTRLDRVMSITREVFHDLRFTTFATNSSVVIFGSSWEQENEFAVALSKTDVNCKIIIAPHEINSTRIETLKNRFSGSCKLLSKTKKDENLSELNVLIIDQIGLLSKLYRYADCAFIGGGFGHGIHNTLEAVAYSKPVLFGPNYNKFQEAYDLINEGAGYCVANEIEFLEAIRQLILDEEVYKNASKNAASYILQNQGATQKIISLLYSN